MKINVCVPTRGKPAILGEFVAESAANAQLPGTRFVIGLDEDDPTLDDARKALPESDRIIHSIAPREDALGAKYNRCAAAYKADLYVQAVDDVAVATLCWDVDLAQAAALFDDGIGFVHFGVQPVAEWLPAMQAATARAVDLMGSFCVPDYPFWWHNTALAEVGVLSGRVIWADIDMRYPDQFPLPPRRDIGFWAKFFDRTRGQRCEMADRIIAVGDTPEWHKMQLRQSRSVWVAELERRNSVLRDPDFVARIESLPDPMDGRHRRLRERAMGILAELEMPRAAA